ncbi:TetR/AcrR family transcriptional regulator [Paenibacillus validus]|uniref:TetR/AcrR family transcriptional regulator n=1 Tax=Paenibacillus TaxID=44249 RepID=UPI000FDB018E|nr:MULTISPECIES: TetR/AcrR family transcriptional regulator [Paenibacillus]MED4601013.1 TetR/AcrR family transcriptional regulator [Paenibacillus validus]MED4604940.1 TetR/AcrR family transcriptional regulator [Paenibacillus validus]
MTFDGSSVNRRQGSDTKTEILDIALSLFVKKGYHETSMQDIADTAGLTKGGLYYYIKSKDDVLFLLHDRFIVEGLRRLRLVEAESLEPEHKLIELLKMHLQIIDQFKDDITLFFNCMKYLSDDKKQAVQEKRDEYEDIFVRVLEEGKNKGVFKVEDSHIVVLYVLGACNFMHTWYKPGKGKSIEELSDIFITLITKGLFQ